MAHGIPGCGGGVHLFLAPLSACREIQPGMSFHKRFGTIGRARSPFAVRRSRPLGRSSIRRHAAAGCFTRSFEELGFVMPGIDSLLLGKADHPPVPTSPQPVLLFHSSSRFSKKQSEVPSPALCSLPPGPRTLPVVVRGCPGHRRHTPKPVSASESALVTTTGHKRIRHVLALQNGGNHAGCLAHAGRLVPAGTREARLIGPEPRSPSPAHSLLFGGTSTAFAILTRALAALAALAAATILGASRRAAGRRCGARRLGRGLAAAAASTAPLAGVGGSP